MSVASREIMNEKKKLVRLISLATLLLTALPLAGDDSPTTSKEQEQQSGSGYCINFNDVPVIEFIRFVSKISEENFIYDSHDLGFNISLSTGKAVGTDRVVSALIQLLKKHGLAVAYDAGYYVIHNSESMIGDDGLPIKGSTPSLDGLLASAGEIPASASRDSERYEFFVYKLQYHEGPEIEESLKKIAADLRNQPDAPIHLINAIQSLQWVKATNSLLCSADAETLQKLNRLVESLDIPLRQVFIEVLVIETDVRNGSEFGLQWAAGGKY